MSRFSTVTALVVALATLPCLASPAHATVMEELSLERLVQESDAIVLGRVASVNVQMVLRQGSVDPHTLTTVRVDRWLEGSGPASITVRELGGVHRLGGMWIEGTPKYTEGEEVVLFLVRHPEHPSQFRTYGMAQGKLLVRRGVGGTPDLAHRDLEGIAFARWTDGAMQLEHAGTEPAMQLGELLAFIERHVRGPGLPSAGGTVGGGR